MFIFAFQCLLQSNRDKEICGYAIEDDNPTNHRGMPQRTWLVFGDPGIPVPINCFHPGHNPTGRSYGKAAGTNPATRRYHK
jgi:hypothetical protein